ncbi:sensor domain-containing protein [Salipaludibacillus daqingensis]|uniref:sensor domain-containing protein n=1 Tax=Salipaludibacillus daqingensis TaxID=3041001 RepID=UPI0024756A7A|nr:EAL domain-containing protein [Salipaludibacillus daqingensis]
MSESSNNKEVVRLTPLWLKKLWNVAINNNDRDETLFLDEMVNDFLKVIEKVSLVIVTDLQGRIVYASKDYLKMSGYDDDKIVGTMYVNLLNHKANSANVFAKVENSIKHCTGVNVDSVHNRNNDERVVFNTFIFPLMYSDKKFANLILHQDVTPLMQAEETIKELVTVDVQTGLKNRKQFDIDLVNKIESDRLKNCLTALLFIDLDRFKYYNDTLGHFTGDKLIEVIAKELMLFENEYVSVYRYGGDEFTIIINSSLKMDTIEKTANHILERFQKSFIVRGKELFITATIGVSLFPETGDTSSTLVQQSEMAMHYAKERGKGEYQLYHPSLQTKRDERLMIEQRLRLAKDSKSFQLFYQPQINLKDSKVVGLEALLRWNDEELGNVSPSKFIPIAEDTGLIFQIGDWVLEQACFQAKSWSDKGFKMRMGINISPKQFQRPDFVSKVKRILRKTGLDPSLLDLEITENDLLYNREECFKTLERLKDIGISISIDDFGTGYSSLSYLRQFPIDTLKIDQSFIKEVIENTNDQAIVTSIIQLAHNMNMRVIAEGVETTEMVLFLNERQCDEMQGFLYSKALPADHVMKFVTDIEPTTVLH